VTPRADPPIRHPELYALVHRGTPGDLAFYLEAAYGADTVLELGCGYARVLAPLADAGHRVVGLDSDPGLLALAFDAVSALPRAARERVELVHGDMREFRLAAKFDRVFIPYNGIYCLGSEAAQLRCLRLAGEHLAPGGILIWDAYAIDCFHATADALDTEEEEEAVLRVRHDGRDYDVFEASAWRREEQSLRVRYRYRPCDGGPALRERIDHRYLLTTQLTPLCAAAGLRLEQACGDFDGAPLGAESEHMVCRARKA
jgi:SAM-dependent methyltransferase